MTIDRARKLRNQPRDLGELAARTALKDRLSDMKNTAVELLIRPLQRHSANVQVQNDGDTTFSPYLKK